MLFILALHLSEVLGGPAKQSMKDQKCARSLDLHERRAPSDDEGSADNLVTGSWNGGLCAWHGLIQNIQHAVC